MFWIVTLGLTLVATALIALTLRRAGALETEAGAFDIQVYRDQLKDVDRDVARGVLDADEAERLRTQVSRRILAADAARTDAMRGGASVGAQRVVIAISALFLIGGSYALYLGAGPLRGLGAPGYGDLGLQDRIAQAEVLRENRPSQATAEAGVVPQARTQGSADYVALVEQLRGAVENRPDDLQGHILLAQAEARLGNFAAAHKAQAQVIALKAGEVTDTDLAGYADLLVLAAGGYVSPEAEAVIEQLLSMAPENPIGRYYYGAMLSQTGRPDLAFRLWDALLRAGPEDAPWIGPILIEIEDLAEQAGVKYQIPPIGSGRGPSQADIQAAEDMSPAERMEMIRGMVTGLSERLATEGGPAEDWAQLIGALVVLGQIEDARGIYSNALEVFADDATALDIIRNAADRAGLI